MPIILAILINEIYLKRFKSVLQTVFTFPHFLSWIIVAGLVINFAGDTGVIKKVAVLFNPEYATTWDLLYNKGFFRGLLIFSDIWTEAGWGTIIYLASIASIDQSLYEAAVIDGCSRFKLIVYITIPGIASMIIIQFLLRVGFVMDGGFDQIFNLYSPPVYQVGDIIDTYIYRITFQRQVSVDFGFPTAVGLFKNVINFALLLIANTAAKKMGNDGIM
jgi:putative aldouronate transport system permease protein